MGWIFVLCWLYVEVKSSLERDLLIIFPLALRSIWMKWRKIGHSQCFRKQTRTFRSTFTQWNAENRWERNKSGRCFKVATCITIHIPSVFTYTPEESRTQAQPVFAPLCLGYPVVGLPEVDLKVPLGSCIWGGKGNNCVPSSSPNERPHYHSPQTGATNLNFHTGLGVASDHL